MTRLGGAQCARGNSIGAIGLQVASNGKIDLPQLTCWLQLSQEAVPEEITRLDQDGFDVVGEEQARDRFNRAYEDR
jgi:hypothetical protein